MKTLVKITVIVILAIGFSSNANAQIHDHSKMSSATANTHSISTQIKTETIKVSGNCDMCKASIEKAAKIEGVSKAEWSKKAKTLTTTFDPSKTSIDAIGKKIAAVGYDNEKAKATDVAYDKLPSCCKYR